MNATVMNSETIYCSTPSILNKPDIFIN